MKQLYESAIAICTIGLAILLFYVAYFCCKRYATDSESVDIEDYIANQSHTIFKERVFLDRVCGGVMLVMAGRGWRRRAPA